MLEIQGKYTSAKIFAKTIEDGVIEQVKNLVNHPLFENKKIRLMPDVHVGNGTCIGLVAEIDENHLIPWLVGPDAGCTVSITKIKGKTIKDFNKLDKVIKNLDVSKHPSFDNFSQNILVQQCESLKFNPDKYIKTIGTIGYGNHFISVEQGASGTYLIIHSGSRNFGYDMYVHYCKKALEQNPYAKSGVLKQLSWLDSDTSHKYRISLMGANTITTFNHQFIIDTICDKMKWKKVKWIDGIHLNKFYDYTLFSIHNFIERTYPNEQPSFDNNWSPKEYIDVLHKGSVSLTYDKIGIIPLNMKDDSLLVKGKNNKDWLNSIPHGAGRLLSRSDANSKLSMVEFKHQMQGIYSSCISTETLDESPLAYKNSDEIIEQISPNAEIIDFLSPLYNFKEVKT